MISCDKCGYGHLTFEEKKACKSWSEMQAELMTKPRFECEECGVDQETFTCTYCVMKFCQSCLGKHEPDCAQRMDGVKRSDGKGFLVL